MRHHHVTFHSIPTCLQAAAGPIFSPETPQGKSFETRKVNKHKIIDFLLPAGTDGHWQQKTKNRSVWNYIYLEILVLVVGRKVCNPWQLCRCCKCEANCNPCECDPFFNEISVQFVHYNLHFHGFWSAWCDLGAEATLNSRFFLEIQNCRKNQWIRRQTKTIFQWKTLEIHIIFTFNHFFTASLLFYCILQQFSSTKTMFFPIYFTYFPDKTKRLNFFPARFL